jgi:glycine hydroxymethyltransferase
MVATGSMPGPFDFADVVTTTTHKSLRGPRGALIFYRKGIDSDIESRINSSVFPGHQGGPHNHTIAGLATSLHQICSPEFHAYTEQILKNAQALSTSLQKNGFRLVAGGTQTHLMVVDVKACGTDGARVERVLQQVGIITNKNTLPGDTSAKIPGGLRVGTPAMTSRGAMEPDFKEIGEFLADGINIAASVKEKEKTKFDTAINQNPRIKTLAAKVQEFTRKFPAVGFSVNESKEAI